MNELATAATGFIQGLSTDLLLIIILGTVFFFYGLYRGTYKLAAILISLYVATFVYTIFPFTFVVISKTWSNVFIWLALTVSIKTILEQLISLPMSFSRIRVWVESGLLSATVIASLIFILYGFLNFAGIYTPTIMSVSVLSSTTYLFWSFVVSFLVFYYIAFW